MPNNLAERLEAKLVDRFGFGNKVPILDLQQVDDPDLQKFANYVYEKVFLGYTRKQWSLRPDELDPLVSARVPVHISRDDRYFQDQYQAIPRYGYTRLFENILDHPNIKLMLNTSTKDILQKNEINKTFVLFGREFNGKIVYTGALDDLFDFCYGPLPYRSLDFEWKTLDQKLVQPTAVINYPLNYDYIRSTEYKHLTSQNIQRTSISYEYPKPCDPKQDIPYYPVISQQNQKRYKQYSDLALTYPGIISLGRLAEFKYYDMDDIVKRAIDIFEN